MTTVRAPAQRSGRPLAPTGPRAAAIPVSLSNAALARQLSATRHGPASVQRSPQQASEMQQAAWTLRGVGAVIAWLGLQGRAPVIEATLGADTLKAPIKAHLVPGKIPDVALVIAGVHGSEQSGVEVADALLAQLAVHQPHFTVVVVPRLFPDNVAGRADWERKLAAEQGRLTLEAYRAERKAADDPGRVTKDQVDPNRQFPALGQDLDLSKPVDAKGRPLEPGNLALHALITAFSPTRIASIHAHKELTSAGVFADPHPSVQAGPLAQEADQLAIETAKRAHALGARVKGNNPGAWSSIYPGQNPTKAKQQMAKENARGHSLGQWGPSKGITVLTVEVAEQYASSSAVDDPNRRVELEAHATALREIFLGPPLVPTATPAPAPASTGAGSGSSGVQRLVVGAVGGAAGNRAALAAAARLTRR